MEEAVYKMTGKAAEAMHIQNRGKLQEGYFADLCIFDQENIKDRGTFLDPAQYPDGVEHVLVNGKIAVFHGIYTGCRNGKVCRRNEEQ